MSMSAFARNRERGEPPIAHGSVQGRVWVTIQVAIKQTLRQSAIDTMIVESGLVGTRAWVAEVGLVKTWAVEAGLIAALAG